jgi:hypothetical protein
MDQPNPELKRPDAPGMGQDSMPAAKRPNRGNYKCSRCGEPKKGHTCAYQPMRSKLIEGPAPDTADAEVQVEVDPEMTVRAIKPIVVKPC